MSKSMLVGYKRFTSKKGDKCCVMNLVTECNEADRNKGAVGSRVEEVFVPSAQVDYLQPTHIGKDIVINYNVSGGRAYVDSIAVSEK